MTRGQVIVIDSPEASLLLRAVLERWAPGLYQNHKISAVSCLPACWIPINLTALTKCPRIAEPVQSINIWHTMAQIQQALWASWQQHWATMMADHPPCQHTASSFLYILQVSSLHISVLQILHEERPFPKYYPGCGQSEYNHSLIFTIFFSL